MKQSKQNQIIILILDDDPFVILPANLKNYEKLGADLFFNMLVKIALYSLLVSGYIWMISDYVSILLEGALM